ncbi:MAG: molybdopterin-dependent oxidoreductase, partial [Gemmatimonadaceae bacterium]|nr:molybdopterin-dependent oxidoreductase [Gemmatimonadaceae bacterium]
MLASPKLSNETLGLLARLFRKSGGSGVFRVEKGEAAPLPGVPGLARREELAANVRGAELLGFTRSDTPVWNLGGEDVLVVADEELAGLDVSTLGRPKAIVVIGSTLPTWARGAAVVLPVGTFAEEEGTFTNVDGRVQRFLQVKAAPGNARPSYSVVGDLLARLGE